MASLTPELRDKIGWFIGRDVPASEEGSVLTFEDFSESDEEEFRKLQLDSVLMIRFIRFRLQGSSDLPTVVSYYSIVIKQGISVAEWNSTYR
jgi:hypothetical protein